jgi:two-component system chemotaxis response regulator CheY
METILVVDDSSTMRRMVMASLRDVPDVTFAEASNGLEAIEQLALGPVSAVVLDLNMPDMHGLEVLEFMRTHPRYRPIPVVVLTTRGDGTSREAAQAAGATAYLTKPFSPAALASCLHAHLAGRGTAPGASPGPAGGAR